MCSAKWPRRANWFFPSFCQFGCCMQEDSNINTNTHTNINTNTNTHTHTQVQTVARVQEQLNASQREHTASLNSLQKLFSEVGTAKWREIERVAEEREQQAVEEQDGQAAGEEAGIAPNENTLDEAPESARVAASTAAGAWRETCRAPRASRNTVLLSRNTLLHSPRSPSGQDSASGAPTVPRNRSRSASPRLLVRAKALTDTKGRQQRQRPSGTARYCHFYCE
jgi:hypothetical protein